MARRQAIFGNEKDLQAQLANSIGHLVQSEHETRLRREMPIGRCIPDLLVVSFSPTSAVGMWPSSWSYRHACIVAALRRSRMLRLSTLASRVHETEESTAEFVRQLRKSGAVEQNATGTLYLSSEMRRLRTHIVAVEAKLARWGEALAQALSYRAFADRVVVAMDAGLFDSSDNETVGHFRKQGVGLCVVDRSGLTAVHPGREEVRPSAQREYVSSSVFLPRTQTAWIRR